MPLDEYRAKRDFRKTSEPSDAASRAASNAAAGAIFVVQEHHASHLHYDFRLEAEGVLKSWSVPKGPSLDPAVKRLAVEVEDHPLGYASFEGEIPKGQYGGGAVKIWDRGTYEPTLDSSDSPATAAEALRAGRLDFVMHGERLRGGFSLIRMKRSERGKPQWLLMKRRDEFAVRSSSDESSPQRPGSAPATRAPRASTPARASRPADPPAEVELTHPERVVYPEAGFTKADVFAYYDRMAERLLPFLHDRPVTLERLPDGLVAGGPHFWQKDSPEHYPDWVPRVALPTETGKTVHYAVVNDRPTLLYLVNQGTLTFHVWASRVADLDRPDFVLFDLDPGRATFADAVAVAHAVKRTLDSEPAEAFVKTSGKTGLHVLTPWTGVGGFDEARAWALERAERVAAELPDRATTDIRKAKRGARVYIDVLQNARGHHVAPPFVLRATPGATVSTPLEWSEVNERLDPRAFTLRTVPETR